nr:AlNc14C143G7299 [Albugo laibachii Nc14]|eukprot:CCA22074.1 AlNc14C143G7299 [Albugo laibachii Nc14]
MDWLIKPSDTGRRGLYFLGHHQTLFSSIGSTNPTKASGSTPSLQCTNTVDIIDAGMFDQASYTMNAYLTNMGEVFFIRTSGCYNPIKSIESHSSKRGMRFHLLTAINANFILLSYFIGLFLRVVP